MFDWLKNIFSHKPENTDENLVEKKEEEHKRHQEKQDLYPHGPSSDKKKENE